MPRQTRRWQVAALARGLDERELVQLGIRALAYLVPGSVLLGPPEVLAAHEHVDMGLGEYEVRWAVRHGDILFTRARQCTSDAAGPSHMATCDKVFQAGVASSPIELETLQSAISPNYWLRLQVTVECPSEDGIRRAMDAVDAELSRMVAAEREAQRLAARRPVIARGRARLLLPEDCRAPSPELPLRLLFIGKNRRGDPKPIEDRHPVEAKLGATGLDEVTRNAARTGGVMVETLDATLEELQADFEDSPEISKSALHRLMVGGTFGGRHGSPYAAMIVEVEVGEAYSKVFERLRAIAVDAHAFIVFATRDELYDSLSWQIMRAQGSARYLLRASRSVEQTALDLMAAFATCGFCADTTLIDHAVAGHFIAARVAHYLKRLRRHRIGSLRDASSIEVSLGAWLEEQCSAQDDGIKPFKEASLRVSERQGGAPFYGFHVQVTPHNEPGAPPVTWGTPGTLDVE